MRVSISIRGVLAALAGVALASLITPTTASPAEAIHRGYDVAISSYRFTVSLRLAESPDSDLRNREHEDEVERRARVE